MGAGVVTTGDGVPKAEGPRVNRLGLGGANAERGGGVFGLDDTGEGLGDALGSGFGDGERPLVGNSGAFKGGSLSVLSSSLSSSPEMGALANGELRVGRVEGLPRPIPKGEGVAGGFEELAAGFSSGEPGGVVVFSSLRGCGTFGGDESVR